MWQFSEEPSKQRLQMRLVRKNGVKMEISELVDAVS